MRYPRLRPALLLAVVGLVGVGAAAPGQAASWSLQPLPARATDALNGISCAQAAACVAVGSRELRRGSRGEASQWQGVRWSTPVASGGAAVLTAVSCPRARWCMAVGYAVDRRGREHPAAERWNGRRWQPERIPEPGPAFGIDRLLGVSCPRSTACVAVGQYGGERFDPSYSITLSGLIMRWHGNRWSIVVRLPARRGDVRALAGVSCATPQVCLAVGSTSTERTEGAPLAWSFDGRRWRDAHAPRVAESAGLSAVSCPSAEWCMAVGNQFISRDQNALSERFVRHRWHVGRVPRPADAGGAELSGVACRSPGDCAAVGAAGDVDPTGGLAERWDGVRWSIESTPGGEGWPLVAVSCAGSLCEAVGFHGSRPIAERRG